MKQMISMALAVSMAGLVACGGGSGNADSSSHNSGSETSSSVVNSAPTTNQRISSALLSGNVSGLESTDKKMLLEQAIFTLAMLIRP